MSKAWARRVLAGLAALAGLELVGGAFAYRDTIEGQDWAALRDALETDDADGMRLATTWLGPRARMEVPALATAAAAAPPDLHGLETLTVVGLDEVWSDDLDRALEGSLRPGLESTRDVGPFTVARYRFRDAPTTVHDWLQTAPTLSTPQGTCRPKGSGWACKEGTVSVAYAEVDYVPRRCFVFGLPDATPLTFSATMPTGTSLRGHVGVSDFNARLRNDAAVRVRTWIDDRPVGTFTASDAQGWHPFVVKTEPGTHEVRVELTDTAGGTWGRTGHDPRRRRKVCFELRALGGGR